MDIARVGFQWTVPGMILLNHIIPPNHMHSTLPLSKSIRKFIRLQKAKLRKTISDPKDLKESFSKLYAQFGSYNAKKIPNNQFPIKFQMPSTSFILIGHFISN